jgi:hypothetical protein
MEFRGFSDFLVYCAGVYTFRLGILDTNRHMINDISLVTQFSSLSVQTGVLAMPNAEVLTQR